MPNTPALIRPGITGMVALADVSADERAQADRIMRAVGQACGSIDEALIDPVTAVSGSGPAYVFYFIEAMQQAGRELGFTAEQARSWRSRPSPAPRSLARAVAGPACTCCASA